MSNSLLDVFNMDLGYFESVAPVSGDILNILMAVGWALLLGNLVFQASKSMVSGIGVEGEDPALLFLRTFLFGFLLLVSRQICDIGLGLTSTIISMLQVPDAVTFHLPEETAFPIAASWLLVVIVGVVIMWQVLKLFLEIGERYVVMAILTLSAPLAFATGGSKNTADIFKGWARMFGSMCVIMVFNVIFLKLLLSAMSYMPVGLDTFPWMLVIVGIARTARKIDGIITRIGLNPAITGDGLGRGLPGMLAYSVIKSMGSVVGKTIGAQGGHRPTAGAGAKSGPPKGPPGGLGGARSGGPGRGQPSPGGTSTANHFADGGASGAAQADRGAPQAGTAAAAASAGATGQPGTHGAAGSTYAASSHQERQDATFTGTAETARPGKAENPSRPPSGGTRRTSVTHPSGHGRTAAPGMAGTAALRSASSPDGAKTPGRAGTGTPPTSAGVSGGPGAPGRAGSTPGSPKSTGTPHSGGPIPQQPQEPEKRRQAADAGGQTATNRFTAVPPSAAPPDQRHQGSGKVSHRQERPAQVPGGKPPRPGQATAAAPPDHGASTQSRVSERTSAQSSVVQAERTVQSGTVPGTGGATRPTPTQAAAPTGHAAAARQERTPSSAPRAGQQTEPSRPVRQERAAPTTARGGPYTQPPPSGTAGTATGQRAAQSPAPSKPPRSPAGTAGTAGPGKRPIPGGKTAPKTQNQRPTRGGGKHGG